MEGFAYFPAIVYRDERPDLIENILPVCLQALDQVRQPGMTIVQSLHLGHEPVLREVADYLLLSSVDILRSQGYSVDKYDFYLSGMWAQETGKGTGTNVHVHKNSQISGWFFLETPENGAYPVYYDTRMNKTMVELDYVQEEEVTNATGMINFNNVVPGTVLFNNSWMNHQIVGGTTDAPTRCIHFIVSHKERMCNT
jgi:uncharacterized protein (TIGR02466 family)